MIVLSRRIAYGEAMGIDCENERPSITWAMAKAGASVILAVEGASGKTLDEYLGPYHAMSVAEEIYRAMVTAASKQDGSQTARPFPPEFGKHDR
jgi:hypothetical protein